MATIFRAQCAVWADSLAPRDASIINPCFKATAPFTDYQSLANSLATGISATDQSSNMVRVRLYDLEGAKPNYPLAEKVLNTNVSGAAPTCRELALCLSFYATNNVPRRRGRCYVPYYWLTTGNNVPLRPTTAVMTQVMDLGAFFASVGGVDIDWVVWSERDHTSHPVTDYWCDDEWDVVRSRGLRATTRQKATTTEGNPPNFLRLQAGTSAPEPPPDPGASTGTDEQLLAAAGAAG